MLREVVIAGEGGGTMNPANVCGIPEAQGEIADQPLCGTDSEPPVKAPVLNKDGTPRKRMGRPPKPKKPPGKPGRPRKGQGKPKTSCADVHGNLAGKSSEKRPGKLRETPQETRPNSPGDALRTSTEIAAFRPVEPTMGEGRTRGPGGSPPELSHGPGEGPVPRPAPAGGDRDGRPALGRRVRPRAEAGEGRPRVRPGRPRHAGREGRDRRGQHLRPRPGGIAEASVLFLRHTLHARSMSASASNAREQRKLAKTLREKAEGKSTEAVRPDFSKLDTAELLMLETLLAKAASGPPTED